MADDHPASRRRAKADLRPRKPVPQAWRRHDLVFDRHQAGLVRITGVQQRLVRRGTASRRRSRKAGWRNPEKPRRQHEMDCQRRHPREPHRADAEADAAEPSAVAPALCSDADLRAHHQRSDRLADFIPPSEGDSDSRHPHDFHSPRNQAADADRRPGRVHRRGHAPGHGEHRRCRRDVVREDREAGRELRRAIRRGLLEAQGLRPQLPRQGRAPGRVSGAG